MYLSLFLVCLTSWLAPALLLLPSPAFSTLKGSIITQPIHIVTLIATPSRSSEGHHSTVMDEQQKDLLRNVLMKVGLDSLLEAFVREKVSQRLLKWELWPNHAYQHTHFNDSKIMYISMHIRAWLQ